MPKRNVARSLPLTLLIVLFSFSLIFGGCSKSDSDSGPSPIVESGTVGDSALESDDESIRSAADIAAGGGDPAIGSDSFGPSTTPAPDNARGTTESLGQRSGTGDSATAPMPPNAPGSFPLAESTPTPAGVPDRSNERALRDDLTADKLSKILEDSDRDMQLIASGRTQLNDPKETSRLMRMMAKIKLEASIKIQSHTDATDKQRGDGMRGHLQSLSHLAAMGDIPSAKALEALANDNLASDEPTIAGDSRIVLIGFAIDALQAGRESAADQAVKLVEGMVENPNSDVPAVLIMARTRQVLSNYGLVDQAARVRQKILSLYGDSSNSVIAQVAADAAGTAKLDPAKRLMAKILGNNKIALARWTEAVQDLATESADMNTVQFLASSALQLEAAGRDSFVEETYSILSERFTEAEAATTMEVNTARKAMEARRDVIGSPMDFTDLPSVDGDTVKADDYEGKIVLMPFWAISVPESLQLVQMLNGIQAKHPDQVSIIGMNLDPQQAPLQEFLLVSDLGFPSYRSVSSPTAEVANPIAARFGLVSMPFVAVFDQFGNVAALDFTGNQLQSIVDRLVNAKK